MSFSKIAPLLLLADGLLPKSLGDRNSPFRRGLQCLQALNND